MPVVGVQDLRCPAQIQFPGGQVGGYPAQQREALQVVAPFGAIGRLIGAARTAIQIGGVDHIHRHVAVRHARQAQADPCGAEDRPEFVDGARMQHRVGDRGQAGQQQPDIGAGADQGLGEGADDIGQTAGLDERKDLRGNVQNLHSGGFRESGRGREVLGRGGAAGHRRASISGVTRVMPDAVR